MTNKTFYRKILIPLFFAVLILFAINFQVTVWFGFFGNLVAPVLWPSLFVHLATKRDSRVRAGWLVFIFLMICSYTVAIPVWVFLSLVILMYSLRFTQKRFSAIDTTDLIAFSAIATFLFPLLYAILASFESDFEFNFWRHLVETILAIPFIPVLLFASRKIDRMFNVEDDGIFLSRI